MHVECRYTPEREQRFRNERITHTRAYTSTKFASFSWNELYMRRRWGDDNGWTRACACVRGRYVRVCNCDDAATSVAEWGGGTVVGSMESDGACANGRVTVPSPPLPDATCQLLVRVTHGSPLSFVVNNVRRRLRRRQYTRPKEKTGYGTRLFIFFPSFLSNGGPAQHSTLDVSSPSRH